MRGTWSKLCACLFTFSVACFAQGNTGTAPVMFLAHATQKQGFRKPSGGISLTMAAKNEYEPFFVVFQGHQTVQGVVVNTSTSGIDVAVYRLGTVSVVNVTDCDSPGPGKYHDPLIPDVDVYVGEKRAAFPFTVQDDETVVVLIDLFTSGVQPGSHQATVTAHTTALLSSQQLTVNVHQFELPTTSSLQSDYGMSPGSLFAGHHMTGPGGKPPVFSPETVALYQRYLDAGLMHRVSGGSAMFEYPIAENLFSDFENQYGSYVKQGRSLPFGLQGAKLTAVRLPCATLPGPSKHSGCPTTAHTSSSWANATSDWKANVTAYWRAVYTNFSRFCEADRILYDYTIDEPTGHDCIVVNGTRDCTANFAQVAARTAALHAVNSSLLSLVTTELCETDAVGPNGSCIMPKGLENVKDDINLWVPMIQYVAGRSAPPGGEPCTATPWRSQRANYDFATQAGKQLWWYLACFSDGGCCAGPQRACTPSEKKTGIPCSRPCRQGWPSYMIDHTALRNRMMQWASYVYNMHGELLWEALAGFNNPGLPAGNGTDGWDQQLIAGGNGEGTLFYPGRPDRIGGQTHIPVTSLRLVMIREGSEDFEYLKLLEKKHGRDKTLEVASAVMRTATDYTDDPADVYSTKTKIAELLATPN